MLKDIDPTSIQDMAGARQTIRILLNLVETSKQENDLLKEEVQRLKDEINRLKGEQGKPDIKPKKNKSKPANYSSEKERRKKKKRKKNSKLGKIEINDTRECEVDTEILPTDAEFKGYKEVVIQDIVFKPNNIKFCKKVYYSPSENKTYLAKLPEGYDGEFGPGIKALVLTLYFDANISEAKILDLLHNAGIVISAGKVSNLLIKKQERFHEEKKVVYEAGLTSTVWQNIDDTGTRVNGQNQYCQIVCNPFYTAYFTTEDKSRLSVIDVLRNSKERVFLINSETLSYLTLFKVSQKVVTPLANLPQNQELSEQEFIKLLAEHIPKLGPLQKKRILDAAAIAAYRNQAKFPWVRSPVVRLLICDDAPQFKLITEDLALCWVHDGRHYKKLTPFISYNCKLVDTFLTHYWDFYDQLLEYKKDPKLKDKVNLEKKFDDLFSTMTGYDALDERISKTREKKASLLMVLDHPEIPLHNNSAELRERTRVRKRDVSCGPRTADGIKAWDTFMTLAATAKKLKINFYQYIYDRISGNYIMPSLSAVIKDRAQDAQLGTSWVTAS